MNFWNLIMLQLKAGFTTHKNNSNAHHTRYTDDESRSAGLTNVFQDLTPTFSGWDTDPAGDISNLTDGDLTTSMTSGSTAVTGPADYAYIKFAVPAGIYIVGGRGACISDIATGILEIESYVGWMDYISSTGTVRWSSPFFVYSSGIISYRMHASDASTITPNIYELWAYRLGVL